MHRLFAVSCLLLIAVAVAPALAPVARVRAQDVPPCTVDQLAGGVFWQGATGTLAGGIVLGNIGDTACTVQGFPTIAPADADEAPIAAVESTYHTIAATPPVVALQPGDEAWASLLWMNWCGAPPPGGVYVLLTVQGETVSVGGWDGLPLQGTPRCDGPADPSNPAPVMSTVQVSRFDIYPPV